MPPRKQAIGPRPKRAPRATAKRTDPNPADPPSPIKQVPGCDVVRNETATAIPASETESVARSETLEHQSLAEETEAQSARSQLESGLENEEQKEEIVSSIGGNEGGESGTGIGGGMEVAENVESIGAGYGVSVVAEGGESGGAEESKVVKKKKVVKIVKKVVKKRVVKKVVQKGKHCSFHKKSEKERGPMSVDGEKYSIDASVAVGEVESTEPKVNMSMGIRDCGLDVTDNIKEMENGGVVVSDSVGVVKIGEIEPEVSLPMEVQSSGPDVTLGLKETGNGNVGMCHSMDVEKFSETLSGVCVLMEVQSRVNVNAGEVENCNNDVSDSMGVKEVEETISIVCEQKDITGYMQEAKNGNVGGCDSVPLGVQNNSEDDPVNMKEGEDSKVGVSDSTGVETVGESWVCGVKMEGGEGDHGLEPRKEDVGEKSHCVGEVPVEVAEVVSVREKENESGAETVEVSSGVDEGVKEKMGKYNEGGLKGEVLDGGMVLSGKLEALGRRKRRKTEIFIGGLGKDAKEDDIWRIFEEVGDVLEVRLVVNNKTGKNKGYAFVRFSSAADAKRALEKHRNVEICGKQCGTAPVEGNDTLFLGNIDKKWRNENVMKVLQDTGIEKIDKVTVMPDPNNSDRNRGFAFVEFETNKDAQIAFKKLQKKDFFGKLKNIKVAWAEPLSEPDEEDMLKVKSVYIEYLPSSWNGEKVRSHFHKFGEIENVVLSQNLHRSKRKDFAFINFATREAALACIESFNHESLDDGRSKVALKVSLAKPVPKGKSYRKVSSSTGKEIYKQKPKAIQSSTNVGNSYTYSGMKRPFYALGDDPYYSYPRGHPHVRMEIPPSAVRPSEFAEGVRVSSFPYYQREGVGFTQGYGYTRSSNNFRSEEALYEEALYRRSRGMRYRY